MMRSIQMAGVTLVAIGLLMAPRARSQEPKKLLMMDINPQGVSKEIASSLTDYLELEIERGRLYQVISQQDLRTLIKVEEQKLLMGNDQEFNQRISEIAKRINARYVLASTLGKVGEAYLLSLELLDAEEIKVLRRVNQTLIGKEQELIGSLRSAVLALTLDEKGVAPDISENLIDKLRISEKKKSFFLAVSPAYEMPIGRFGTSQGMPAFRPAYFHLRLDAEIPVWNWINLYGSFSVGTTVLERFQSEDDHIVVVSRVGETEPLDTRVQATIMDMEYSALRIPFNLGIKVVPKTGRFLPYALVGIGLSWTGYSFDQGSANVIREPLSDGTCPPPFELLTDSGLDQCLIEDITMKPEKDISTFGFDAVAAAGFQWLLTHHLGVVAEVRYHFTYSLNDLKDLRFTYTGQSEPYTSGTETLYDRHLEVYALQEYHEGLVFSLGMVTYW